MPCALLNAACVPAIDRLVDVDQNEHPIFKRAEAEDVIGVHASTEQRLRPPGDCG